VDVGKAQQLVAALARAHELAGAADVKIAVCDRERR
jgi:hypothetical protein